MQKSLSNCSRGTRAGRSVALGLTLLAFALMCACGGGSPNYSASTTSNPAPGVTLEKIKITPTSSIILLSQTRQLSAQGIYSDGSTQDLSSAVSWSASSSNSTGNFVSVSSSGLATATGIGSTSISASVGSVTGVLTLSVGTNGFSSSTMAILSVLKGNAEIDVAYLPQQTKIQSGYAVQEVDLDADQFSSFLPVPVALMASIAMPKGYVPNAAAASQASGLVAVISYSSPNVQIIDASNLSNDLANNTIIATYVSPVSQSVTLNGTSCMICAVVVNPLNNQLTLSTAQGFYSMNLSTGVFTQIPFNPAPAPSANITIDPTATPDPFILSTVPNAGEIQILDLTTNAVTTFGANAGVSPSPVAGVIDLTTQYSTVVDGSTSDQTLIDFTDSQAPVIDTLQGLGVCGGGPVYMNMVAVGVRASATVQNPFLLTGQTSGSCVGLQQFPVLGVAGGLEPGNVYYAYGPMPSTPGSPSNPDGEQFVSSGDPNAIATFTSVVQSGSPLFGLLLSLDQQWLAKISFATATGFVPNFGTPGGPTLPSGILFDSTQVLANGMAGNPVVFLPTPSTQFTLSQDTLNFGTVSVGTASPPLTVTFTDISTQAMVTPQITLAGSDAGDFSLLTSCTVGLQPLSNCAVNITFTPTAANLRTAVLNVAVSGQPTQEVSLTGTGD
jgi:hypothetical protein